jgi:uncharacterized protein (TIGR00255 family)
VSSVNRKSLDLTVKQPEAWEPLEPVIGEQVRKIAIRGKVHVDIELTGLRGAGPEWDEVAAGEVIERLAAFAKTQKIEFEPTPELLWQIASSQRRGAEAPAVDVARPVVERALGEALRGFAAMRAKEGEALLVDLLTRIGLIAKHVAAVAERAPHVPGYYREQFRKRLREAGLEIDLDDERVLKEIALFADRCDISEELTRLRSHLDQFGALLKADGEVGRKAEFLLLEMGREVHTIGSKANDLTISRAVIELKNELERVKEQMANVE